MKRILIFSGTTEGRELAEFLRNRQVDVIVSALPSTRETHHLFNREMLACCKSTAILFNVGRGDAIDSQALIDALRAGRPGVAVLDVFEEEPLPTQAQLWQLPNLIITPHNSAWSLPEQVVKIFEQIGRASCRERVSSPV